MSATLADLLSVLDHQRNRLVEGPRIPGVTGGLPVGLAWSWLARAALRTLTALPGTAETDGHSVNALLLSLAHDSHPRPVPAAHQPLADVSTTIGTIGDLLSTPATSSRLLRARAQAQVSRHVLAALHASAQWTVGSPPSTAISLRGQLHRLMGMTTTEPHELSDQLALYPWRSVRADDPGLDGAVTRWSHEAAVALTSPHHVTQLALQLTAADIALVCDAAAAALSAAVRTNTVDPAHLATATALADAGCRWRQATLWPSHVRLGGRTPDLRNASQDLRAQIVAQLRDGNHWAPDASLGVPSVVSALLWATQVAATAGGHHVRALHELAFGRHRAWVAAAHAVDVHRGSSARRAWIADSPGDPSAALLHTSSQESNLSIGQALTMTDLLSAAREQQVAWERVAPNLTQPSLAYRGTSHSPGGPMLRDSFRV